MAETGLTGSERALLDFEGGWWRLGGERSKAVAIKELLSMSPSRYYALLGELAERQDAAAYHPLVVHRVRRRKAEARRAQFVSEPPRRRSPH